MSIESIDLSVSQARDHFSEAVNRAVFGGEITYVTRARGHQRAATIVPVELVEHFCIACDQLADQRSVFGQCSPT
ncbi:MAG: hypothetical protein ACRDTG_19430 [Pseudonocardiaceae bacterium]